MSVTKKIKQGKIDIDYEDSAILVNYDVEMVEMDHNGIVLQVLDKKAEVRRIKIKSLSADKNMAQLAADIVEKCPKYIHPSRTEEVEQLLIRLRKYAMENGQVGPAPQHLEPALDASRKSSSRGRERGNRDKEGRRAGYDRDSAAGDSGHGHPPVERAPPVDPLPPAHIEDIDEYLEMLYQVAGRTEKEKENTIKQQEKGTGMILKLCRDVMNLEQLIQNATVMGALTRVLQEEFKKSLDLTFNILRIFLAFSNFMEMHSLMANYRIGVLTMKALDFEIKRSELRETEKQDKEAHWATELQNTKLNNPMEYPATADRIRKSKEKEAARDKLFVRKQDKLLFVGFYILLNLAEDLNVERKMVKKNLIHMIATMMNRRFEDLLILCVTFLKKLATIDENKEVIQELNLTERLVRFMSSTSQPLVQITLRCLYNLAFDKNIREQMLKTGFVPKLIGLLKIPAFRPKIMKLLYLLSVDDRCKSMATYTEGIPLLMGMVINFPQDYLAKELGAVMINFSLNPRNCEQMVANRGLNLLMDRLEEKRGDVLLVKIIRNISLWTFNQQQETDTPEMNYRWRGLWSPHIKVLFQVMKESDGHDMLVEIFGILANMTIYDLPQTASWAKLLKEYHLLGMFSKMLVPGMAQNDLLLELIMMISSMASDTQACNTIASSTLINQLYQLWKEKSDDVEVLLQLLHCFHKLFLHEASREEAMYSTRVVVDIIACLGHHNPIIRDKAGKITEIVLEFDRGPDGHPGQLGAEIIRKRFESYNLEWIQAMNALDSAGMSYGGGAGVMGINSYDYDASDYAHEMMHGGRMSGYDMGDAGSVGGTSSHGSYDGAAASRMRGSREEELNMATSARYFSDKVDTTMESYNKINVAEQYVGGQSQAITGGRVDYSGGGEYKVNFADSVDDSGDSWQNTRHK